MKIKVPSLQRLVTVWVIIFIAVSPYSKPTIGVVAVHPPNIRVEISKSLNEFVRSAASPGGITKLGKPIVVDPFGNTSPLATSQVSLWDVGLDWVGVGVGVAHVPLKHGDWAVAANAVAVAQPVVGPPEQDAVGVAGMVGVGSIPGML